MPQRRKFSEWRASLRCVSLHKRRLSAYLDGELDVSRRAGVEKHLGACARCRDEYEQLRFASRALSSFEVPEARRSFPQFDPATLRRHDPSPVSWLQKFYASKIAVPAPAFAVVTLAAFIVAAMLLTGRIAARTQPSVASSQASAPTIETKIIEVPVEREVVRERIVTRIVHVREPRREQSKPSENKLPLAAGSLAGRTRNASRGESNSNRQMFVRASVEGFRPATDANLRIVREPEQ